MRSANNNYDDDDDVEIVLLKIGGSSITNKAQEESLNVEALEWFAQLLSSSIDPSFLSREFDGLVRTSDDDNYNINTNSSNDNSNPENTAHDVSLSCSETKTKTLKKKKKRQFIVVHGAGSFGHHSAKRFGLRCGKAVFLEEEKYRYEEQGNTDNTNNNDNCNAQEQERENYEIKQRYQMEGLSKTRQSVQKLNAATVHCLIQHGVNAVGISPGMTISGLRAHGATALTLSSGMISTAKSSFSSRENECAYNNDIMAMQQLCDVIQQSLQAGLVPVVHGDACLLHDGKRAGILGGDTIVEGLAMVWNSNRDKISTIHNCCNTTGETTTMQKRKVLSQVIFITDVAGVFTSDPKLDPHAALIRKITIQEKTGKIMIDDSDRKNDCPQRQQCETNGFHVGGSTHEHDVTGGLKAKLGAAVTIVQAGVNVIISQCCSDSTSRYVKGDWDSIGDVETGTLLTLSQRDNN